MDEARKYLDPAFLGRLANLDLVARCAVEGLFAGVHPSAFHGLSVEYSDHRQYHPGDEIRFIDWKVFGRTDKLTIKQFLQQTNSTVHLLLDSSRSMGFASAGQVTKLDYGSFLAAALTLLLLRQADCPSLILFAERIRRQIPPQSRSSQLGAVLHALQANRPAGRTRLADVLHTVAEMSWRRGLVVLISDLIDDEQDILDGLAHLAFLRHDVIVFQVLDRQELLLEYDEPLEFRDMESADRVRAFPAAIRGDYQRQVQAYLREVRTTLGNRGIDYCLCDTAEPLDRALLAFLARRKRTL
ncbi:MAG: DUF58 domain-containing protein [Phycisphaerae bacterium]|nr:DUF58 domain-containing protein [Phycisphaerae bacterium]